MPRDQQISTFNGNWGLWCHAFQGANTSWLSIFEQRIINGNFFLGLQGHSVQVFATDLPPGAVIESAVMRMTPFSSNGAARLVNLNTPNRSLNLKSRPLLSPCTHFTGWRPDVWSNADMRLESTTATLIIETSSGVNNAQWIFRQIQAGLSPLGVSPTPGTGHRDRLAQRFTMPSTANNTLGNIQLQMTRTAVAPAGDIRLQIMDAVLDSDGSTLVPSETVLATSDPVSMSTFLVNPSNGPVNFAFTGGDQITLTTGNEYFVVAVPDAYTINNTNWVAMRHQNQFFTTGKLMHYGEGIGCDWQNFPGTTEVYSGCTPPGNAATTNVTWNVPTVTAGVAVNSPDISSLVQYQVDQPAYRDSDRSIIIGIGDTGGGNSNRIWRSNGHPSGTPPRLDVVWRPRKTRALQQGF